MLCGFGEVGRGDEDFPSIDDDEFGVEAGSLLGIGFEGPRVVEYLRAGVPGPVFLPEIVGEPGDDARRDRGVLKSPADVHVQDDFQRGFGLQASRERFEDGLRVVEGVAGENDLVLGFLE